MRARSIPRILAWLCLALASSTAGPAQGGDEGEQARRAPGPRVWGTGSPQHLYLVPLLHDEGVSATELPPEALRVIDGSARVCLVAQPVESRLRAYRARRRLPPGRTLRQVLPAEVFAQVVERARARDVDMQSLMTGAVWWVAQRLQHVDRLSDFDGTSSVLAAVRERCARRGVVVWPLPALPTHGALSAARADAEQIERLQAVLASLEAADADGPWGRGALYAAWRSGDWPRIESALKADLGEPAPGDLDHPRRLVAHWSDAALRELIAGLATWTSQPTTICAGVGQCVGPDGLLARLRAAGHDLQPIRATGAPPPRPVPQAPSVAPPSAAAPRPRAARVRGPLWVEATAAFDAGQTWSREFAKGRASEVASRAARLARAMAIEDLGPERGALLASIRKEDLLVVGGSFDHIERALDALKVPYTKVAPWSLTRGDRASAPFEGFRVVLWNCGEALGRSGTRLVASRLRDFVRRGGFLYATDWSVVTILEHAFPGQLKSRGNRAHLPEMVVPIVRAERARDHLLLRGVPGGQLAPRWWLEQASFDVAPGPAFGGEILVEAPTLAKSFGRNGAAVVTFPHGSGQVLHCLGHCWQESGNLAGAVAAQRLVLNFVLWRMHRAATEPSARPPR